MFQRYGIYFVPDGRWGDLGAHWLGWDNRSGELKNTYDGVHKSLIERPQKYGFHATVKAPFRLAADHDEASLAQGLESLCASLAPLPLASLQLAQIGRFFAFTSPTEQSQLVALSSRVVRDLDRFRAPLSEADIARRRSARLTPDQDALMLQWGYPYVMEHFKFHLTLTVPVPNDTLDTEQAINAHFAPALADGLHLNSLSLMGERSDGYFTQIARCPLEG